MSDLSQNVPFTLGVYSGDPNGSDLSEEKSFESDYSSFVSTLGTVPTYLDTYTDYTQPIDDWVGSANFQATSDAQSPDAKNLIPVISLPMASTDSSAGSADSQYQAIAAGDYDSVYEGILQAYVAQGYTNLVFRPGWEMNIPGPTYAGDTTQDQADWVAAYKQIYTVLHQEAAAVGINVTVVWNPGVTNYTNANALTSLYPGNAYVDAIGADVYSDIYPYSDGTNSSGQATYYDWNTDEENTSVAQFITDPVNREHYWTYPAATKWADDSSGGHALSLDQLLAFAEVQGKPFAIPETGAGNSDAGADVSDDAAFPQWLASQLTTAEAAGEKIDFVNIWDSNAGGGNYEFSNASDDKPLEAAAWAEYFGAQPIADVSEDPVATVATVDGAAEDDTITANASGDTIVAGLGVTLQPEVAMDFGGDSKSDILLQNTNGTVDTWLMNGSTIASDVTIANPGVAWTPIGNGDFNGDGKSDILLQNSDGSVALWEMNGGTVASSAVVANPGTSWHAVATGDFNGDGKSDVLLQNDDGSVAVWQMNGESIASSAVVANPGPTWHAVGTGDFNGDGKSDVLLQNDDGSVAVWQMNGESIASSAVVANPGTSWHAVGTGDFNGDGKSDVVLQNNDGTVALWEMNGGTIQSSAIVADPGPTWHVVGTGDYNGAGTSDILLQNDDGTVADWALNNASITSSTIVANPGPAWQTTGNEAMHFINDTQSTGTLAAPAGSDDFILTTFQPGSHVITGFDPTDSVITLSQSIFGSYAAVQQNETQSSGSTIINLGSGSSLTLEGVLPTALTAKNFV